MLQPSNWLDDYFGPQTLKRDAVVLPKRGKLRVLGLDEDQAYDDPTNKETVLDFSALVSGSAELFTSGGAINALDVICTASDAADPAKVVTATTTPIARAGNALGVALALATIGQPVPVATAGDVVDLGLGAPPSGKATPVIVTPSAGAAFKANPDAGDFVLGLADGLHGYVTIQPHRTASIFVNVKMAPYNAAGDGVTDDAAAIQRALDDVGAAGGGTVFVPAGDYICGKPLFCRYSYVTVLGAGDRASRLNIGAVWGTSGLIIGPNNLLVDTSDGFSGNATASTFQGPSLFTGDARPSFRLMGPINDGGSPTAWTQYWLNLRHSPGAEWNGLAAFSCSFRWRKTGDPSGGAGTEAMAFIASGGTRSANDTPGLAFKIYYDFPNQQIGAIFSTAGGGIGVTSGVGSVIADDDYDVEFSWDGTTARLYVGPTSGGTIPRLAESLTYPGAMKQEAHEDVRLGADGYNWPNMTPAFGSPFGYVDALHVSKVARHTGASFAVPTTKPTADADTLILLNGDDATDYAVKGTSQNGFGGFPTWWPIDIVSFSNSNVSGATVRNIGLAGNSSTAILAYNAPGLTLDHVRGDEVRVGAYLWQNCFSSLITDCTFVGNTISQLYGWIGIAVIYNSTETAIRGASINAYRYGVCANASSVALQGGTFNGNDPICFVLANGTGNYRVSLSGPLHLSDELNVSGSRFAAALYLGGVSHFHATNVNFEHLNSSTGYPVVVDAGSMGKAYAFENCMFDTANGTQEVMHVLSAPSSPIRVTNPQAGLGTLGKITTSTTVPIVVEPRNSNGRLAIELTADADRTLTADEWSYQWLTFTDSPTTLSTGRNVIAPKLTGWTRAIRNETAQTLTIKGSTGTGVDVPAGEGRLVGFDGTNFVDLLEGLGGSGFTAGGDLSGTSSSQQVESVTGNATGANAPRSLGSNLVFVRPTAKNWYWDRSVNGVVFGIEAKSGNGAAANFDVYAQDADPGAGSASDGGNARLFAGAGRAGGVSGRGQIYVAGALKLDVGDDFIQSRIDVARFGVTPTTLGTLSGHVSGTTTTSTAADQTVATLAIPANGSFVLTVRVTEKVGTTQTESGMSVIAIHWNGSAFSASTSKNSDLSDNSITPKLTLSGSNVLVKVTPVSASSATHKVTYEWQAA